MLNAPNLEEGPWGQGELTALDTAPREKEQVSAAQGLQLSLKEDPIPGAWGKRQGDL